MSSYLVTMGQPAAHLGALTSNERNLLTGLAAGLGAATVMGWAGFTLPWALGVGAAAMILVAGYGMLTAAL